MPKFFVNRDAIREGTATITGGDAAHIARVLRLPVGSELVLCDGEGMNYEARLEQIEKDRVVLCVGKSFPCETEPSVSVTLFQGLPKAVKMEYIIQKCTELGVSEIVPVRMKRSVVKLEGAPSESKKNERWMKIAAEAAKQCGRGRIPAVSPVGSLSDVCGRAKEFDLLLAPYEEERDVSLRAVLRAAGRPKKIGIVIGPEGGFEPEEIEQLREAGAACVTLGKRILRTETAGHTVLTAVLYEIGELE